MNFVMKFRVGILIITKKNNMSTLKCKPTLGGLVKTDYNGVNNQAGLFILKMYELPLVFVSPKPTKAAFKAQYDLSISATENAITGGPIERSSRTKENGILLDMMTDEVLPYLVPVCGGDKVMIESSGAIASHDKTKQTVFAKPIINKLVRGTEAKTVKVIMVKGKGETKLKRGSKMYLLYIFAAFDSPSPKETITCTSSFKLLAKNVTVLVEQFYSVAIQNSAGISEPSNRIGYTLTN